MNETEVRMEAFKIAVKNLGDTSDIYSLIDYAEKIKMFVADEWNSEEIKAELENRES